MSDGVSTQAIDTIEFSVDEVRRSLEVIRSKWHPKSKSIAYQEVTSSPKPIKMGSQRIPIQILTEIRQQQGTAHSQPDTRVTYQSSGWVCINQPQAIPECEEENQVAPSLSRVQILPTTQVISIGGLDSLIESSPLGFIDGLDIENMLQGKPVNFQPQQKKKMCLWLKENNARGILKHRNAFQELLQSLGFTDFRYSKEVHTLLHKKVRYRVSRYGSEMEDSGATIVANKGLENETIYFADWTDLWLLSDWDGSIEKPAHMVEKIVKPDPIHVDQKGERCLPPLGPEFFVVDDQLRLGELDGLHHYEELDEKEYWSDEEDCQELNRMDGITCSTTCSGTTNATRSLPHQQRFGNTLEHHFITNPYVVHHTPQMKLHEKIFQFENRDTESDGYYPRGVLAVSRDKSQASVESYQEDQNNVELYYEDDGESIGQEDEEAEDLEMHGAEMVVERVESDESGDDGDGELSDTEHSETVATISPEVHQLATMASLHYPSWESGSTQLGGSNKSPCSHCQHCVQSFIVIEIESPENFEKWRNQLRAISLTQNIWDILTGVHIEPILSMSPQRKKPKLNVLPYTSIYGPKSLATSSSFSNGLEIKMPGVAMEVEDMEYDEEPAEYERKLLEWNSAREKALVWMFMTMGPKTKAGVRAYEKNIGKDIQDPRVLMSLLEGAVQGCF